VMDSPPRRAGGMVGTTGTDADDSKNSQSKEECFGVHRKLKDSRKAMWSPEVSICKRMFRRLSDLTFRSLISILPVT